MAWVCETSSRLDRRSESSTTIPRGSPSKNCGSELCCAVAPEAQGSGDVQVKRTRRVWKHATIVYQGEERTSIAPAYNEVYDWLTRARLFVTRVQCMKMYLSMPRRRTARTSLRADCLKRSSRGEETRREKARAKSPREKVTKKSLRKKRAKK